MTLRRPSRTSACECWERLLQPEQEPAPSDARWFGDCPRPLCGVGRGCWVLFLTSHLHPTPSMIQDLDITVMVFHHFGKDFPKSEKLSPDAFIQMALQCSFSSSQVSPRNHLFNKYFIQHVTYQTLDQVLETQRELKKHGGTSLVVQWFRLHTSSARGVGLIPGTKIPHAMWCGKNKNQQNKTKNHGNHPQGDPKPLTRLLYNTFSH